ncbi:MAG: sideroflexin, partial [archaeon]|nr:sideroflexin [archaeon]
MTKEGGWAESATEWDGSVAKRLWYYFRAYCNPLGVLISRRDIVSAAKVLLNPASRPDERLQAQLTLKLACHPDSCMAPHQLRGAVPTEEQDQPPKNGAPSDDGDEEDDDRLEETPRLVRRCAHFALNVPMFAGMLVTASNPLGIAFFQALNQFYTCFLNHYTASNRTSPSTSRAPPSLAASLFSADGPAPRFAAATALSTAVALGAHAASSRLLARRPFSARGMGWAAALMHGLAPSLGVVAAGTLNLWIIRKGDLRDGVWLRDPVTDRRVVRSRAAAEQAFSEACISRALLPLPALLAPPLLWHAMSLSPLPASSPGVTLARHLLVPLCLLLSLPLSLAPFPLFNTFPVDCLEPSLRSHFPPDRTHLYYFR